MWRPPTLSLRSRTKAAGSYASSRRVQYQTHSLHHEKRPRGGSLHPTRSLSFNPSRPHHSLPFPHNPPPQYLEHENVFVANLSPHLRLNRNDHASYPPVDPYPSSRGGHSTRMKRTITRMMDFLAHPGPPFLKRHLGRTGRGTNPLLHFLTRMIG